MMHKYKTIFRLNGIRKMALRNFRKEALSNEDVQWWYIDAI